jgi:hypothetical protein
MENYRVNKIHIGRGEAEADMNFIDPIFSVLVAHNNSGTLTDRQYQEWWNDITQVFIK